MNWYPPLLSGTVISDMLPVIRAAALSRPRILANAGSVSQNLGITQR